MPPKTRGKTKSVTGKRTTANSTAAATGADKTSKGTIKRRKTSQAEEAKKTSEPESALVLTRTVPVEEIKKSESRVLAVEAAEPTQQILLSTKISEEKTDPSAAPVPVQKPNPESKKEVPEERPEDKKETSTKTLTAVDPPKEVEKPPAKTKEQLEEERRIELARPILERNEGLGNMDYLKFEEIRDAEDPSRVQTLQVAEQAAAAYPTRASNSNEKEYWNNNAPVLEKVDFNGETIMIPKIAPRTANVSIRKAGLDYLLNALENHAGGYKITWGWKVQVLSLQLRTVVPALLASAKQMLPDMTDRTAMGVYAYADATMYDANLTNELRREDPATPGVLDVASRAACRFIGMTLSFDPRMLAPNGNMVVAANLPSTSTQRVYIRAPQAAAGGLANTVTLATLNAPVTLLLPVGGVAADLLMAERTGQVPMKENYDRWIEGRYDHVIFFAMKQISIKTYIGAEVATDNLQQRIYRVGQKKFNTATRRVEYCTVGEYQSELLQLINETNSMTQDQICAQVPELDAVFYQGLVPSLKEKPRLAALVNSHAPSGSLGENLANLQAFVNAATEEEQAVEQIVKISLNSSYRRNPVQAGGTAGRTFSTDLPQHFDTPTRATMVPPAATLTATEPAVPTTQFATFAITALSSAERALRESSSTNSPNIACWGCDGPHLFKDCPRKNDAQVQVRFKAKLDEFLQRRRRNNFNPQTHKRDGFATKRAVTLFNEASNPSLGADARSALINSFVQETLSVTGQTRGGAVINRANTSGTTQTSGNAISFPFWILDGEDHTGSLGPSGFTFIRTFNTASTSAGDQKQFTYPITSELPHAYIPIGKDGRATAEGMMDTGGACTMGDLAYWSEVATRFPEKIAHFEELSVYQEKPINIGGVGAGKVQITHVMGLWLPWIIGTDETKLVVGLGDNMPVTLLVGLPFLLAAQVTLDLSNMKCHSKVFNATWKLDLKRPQRKDMRTLDAAVSSGKRLTFPVTKNEDEDMEDSESSPKKIRWDWQSIEQASVEPPSSE